MPIGNRDDIYRGQQGASSSQSNQNTGGRLQGGTPANFSQLYKSIAEKASQEQQQQREDRSNEREDASLIDKFSKGVIDTGEELFNLLGAQDAMKAAQESGGLAKNPLGTLGAIALSIPGGIIGSPVKGAGQLYEVATGRDVQSMDDDGTISAERLDASQRAWEGLDAGINLGGGFIGGSGRILGAGGKALSKMDNPVGDFIGKLMPNEGRGIISKELGKAGFSKGAQVGGQIASDMAEEAAEEFVQTYAEHGRAGDDFNNDTFGEAVESGIYGAIGGGMMSAGGLAMNSAIKGRQSSSTADNASKPDNSGFKALGEVKESVPISRQQMAPSAKQAFDTLETKRDTETNNGFGLILAPGHSDIGLDDAWIGIEGLKAQWGAADQEGRAVISKMLGLDENVINNALATNDFATLNANLGRHAEYNRRSIKREPGTAKTTIHDVWVTKIVPGTKMQLHPMTSQLANGDIDGDTKTVLQLPGHEFLLPSQLFLNSDGSTDYSLDYLPNLDTEPGREALKRRLSDNLGQVKQQIGDQPFDQLVNMITNSASRAKVDQDVSGKEFLKNMQDLATLASNISDGDVSVISDVVSGALSAMYDANTESEVIDSLLDRIDREIEDLTYEVAVGDALGERAYRQDSGSEGNAKAKSAIAYDLGEIHSLVYGLLKGASLREGQTDKYNIVKRISKMNKILSGAGQSRIDRIMLEWSKITDFGEDINENITNMFNTYMLTRFVSEVGFSDHNKIGDGIDADAMVDKFIEIRNDLGSAFNESIKKTFTSGKEGIVGSIPKTNLSKESDSDRNLAIGYMLQTLDGFTVNNVFDVPSTSSMRDMFIGDMVDLLSKQQLREPVYDYVGEDGAKLLSKMVDYHRKAPGRIQQEMIDQLANIVNLDNNELSLEENYATATWILESILGPMNQEVILESEIWDVYRAAKSKYGYDIFMGNASDRANVRVSLTIEVMYKDVLEMHRKFEETNDSKYLEAAKQYAARRVNGSSITKAIYAELNKSGSVKWIEFFSDIDKDFNLKQNIFNEILDQNHLPQAALLTDVLTIGQDLDSLKSSVRENLKAVSQASLTAIEDARLEGERTINYMTEILSGEAQQNVMQVFADYIRESVYRVNDDIFASLIMDSTDMHLHDNEKGTTIESAAMLFQQMELLGLGGPTSLASEMQSRTVGSMSLSEFMTNKMALVDVLFNGKTIYLWDAEWSGTTEVSLESIFKDMGSELHGPDGTMSVNDLALLFRTFPQIVRTLEPHMITPSLNINEDGGVSQTGTPKAVGSLCNGFQGYMNRRSTNVGGLREAYEKSQIEREILNDKRFAPVFASFLIPNDDGTISYQEVLDKKDWLIDCLHEHIGRGTNVEEIKTELMRSGMEFFSKKIVGESQNVRFSESDVAKMMSSGDVGLAFTPRTLANEWTKKAMERLYQDQGIDPMTKELMSDLTGGVALDTFEDFQKVLTAFGNSYKRVVAENQGISEYVRDINGGVFAIVGRENIKKLMVSNFQEVFRYSSSIDENIKQQVIDAIDSIVNETCDQIFDSNRFFYKEDLASMNDEQIEAKINKMLSDNKTHHKTVERMQLSLTEALSESDSTKRLEMLDKIRIGANDLIVANAINSLGDFTDAHVNEYFMEDIYTIVDAFCDMYEELRGSVTVAHHNRVSKPEIRNLPQLRVSDPRNISTAVMAGRHSAESQIATNVAINGYVMTQSYGWASIPHNIRCNADPTEPQNIRLINVTDHMNEEAIVTYPNGETRTITVSDSIRPLNYPEGTTIQFYDKDSCTCPMCSAHRKLVANQFSQNSIHTTTAYISLLEYAQEAKNLKLKKALELAGKIVPNATKDMDPFVRVSHSVPQGADQTGIFNLARTIAKQTEESMYGRYYNVLASYMSEKKIPQADIRVMAEMNSSVMMLEGVNGEKCLATLYELNDEAIFKEITERLGGGIATITAHPVSYEQINAKIETELLKANRGKDGVTKADTDPVAIRAVQEWRNHGTDSMSMKSILSMMPLVQKGGPSNIIPGKHPTAEQAFRDVIMADGKVKHRFNKRPPSAPLDRNASYYTDNLKFQFPNSDDKNRLQFLITKVEVKDSYEIPYNEREREQFEKLRGLNSDKHFYGSMPSAAVILAADNDIDVESIVKNGYEGFDYVFVPKSAVQGKHIPFDEVVDWFDDRMVRLDLTSLNMYGDVEPGVRYSQVAFDPRMVYLTFNDDHNFYMLGDAAQMVDPRGLQNYDFRNNDPIVVEFEKYLDLGTVPSVVPGREIADVARRILDNDATIIYPEIKNLSKEEVEARTEQWLKSMINDQSSLHEDGYVMGGVSINSMFALVVQKDAAGNSFYMPAFATGNIPNTIDSVLGYRINRKNKTIEFMQDTRLEYSDDMLVKSTQGGQASKGMVIPFPSDHKLPIPKAAVGLGDFANVAINNNNTRKGRIEASSETIDKVSLFLLTKLMPSNAMFIPKKGKGIAVNDMLNVTENGDGRSFTPEQVDELFARNSNSHLWNDVINGNKDLFKDQNANKIVMRLAAGAMSNNGVIMSTLLCPFETTVTMREYFDSLKPDADPTLIAKVNDAVMFPKMVNVGQTEIPGVFKRLTFSDMLSLYSKVNPHLCKDPYSDTQEDRSYVMNEDGKVLSEFAGKIDYHDATFSIPSWMSNDDRIGEKQVNASFSAQQRIRYGMENGISDSDVGFIMKQINAKYGDLQVTHDNMLKDIQQRAASVIRDLDSYDNLLDIDLVRGMGQDALYRQIEAQQKTFDSIRISFKKRDGSILNPSQFHNDSDYMNLFNSFKKICWADRTDKYISDLLFVNLIKLEAGWSYSDGDGSMVIDFSTAEEFVRNLDSNLSKKILIKGKSSNASQKNTRVSFGLLPRNIADECWEVLPRISKEFESMDNFKEKMFEQESNTVDVISTFLTAGRKADADPIAKKRDALYMMHHYLNYTWGEPLPNNVVYTSVVTQDIIDSEKMALSELFGKDASDEYFDFIERAGKARDEAIKSAIRQNKRGLVEIEISSEPGGSVTYHKSTKRNPLQKALDGSVNLMRVMGVMDPGVSLGGIYEGFSRNMLLSAATNLDFGPWSKGLRSIQDTSKYNKIAANPELQQFLKLMREANLRGDIDALLLGISAEGKTLEEIADEMYGSESWWPKVRDRIFKVASMDQVFIKRQTSNMLRFLDTYVTQKGYPEHMRKVADSDGNKKTMFEVQLETDPVKYLTTLLSPDSSVRMDVGRAINTSNTVSFAQRNAVSIIAEHITKKSSVANAITAFTLTPFIRYNTNVMGRILNWFMPISSMNYVMVDTMSRFDTMKDLGIEQAQVYTSFWRALMVDATKMIFTAVAAIILALGLLEPPDDEDKRGDYREYMFFGHRIYENWVLTDLTGPIFPYACFMQSVMNGNPRFDVLFNGLSDVASKNPLMKVGEVLDIIMSPDQLEEELMSQQASYEDTLGGEPSLPDVVRGNTGATVLSLAGRIITPSFVRNWGKAYDYQRSYNTVWDPTDPSAVNLSTGTMAKTKKVDYDEAMIRKVTRDNPILGVFMNFLTDADTSYTGATTFGAEREMTPVIVQDPMQRAIRNEYSIGYKNEEGEWVEKSEQEKQAVALNIIATLQSYSDMEELYQTGFMLDTYTRRYVGDLVWQTVAEIQTEYYNWAHSEDSDYYVLGGGDYWTGSEIKQQAYNQMNQSVQYWKDFYYNKLNSEPMRRGIQRYLRENTEWFKDDNGDWYASGFRRGMTPLDYLAGVKVAPGTKENPDGTMGYYGDWDTPSAVVVDPANGEPMSTGERALVPLFTEKDEVINFDDLAENNPELAAAVEKAKNGGTSSSERSGYSRRSSGGGGGGGGGGHNLYSRPASVNVPSARTISTSRPYDSRFDYLRPGFETKGSREASRRSDF